MPFRILVVDDHPHIRQMLRLILSREGHAVSEAGSGAEALARWRSDRPDAILLDFNLPVVPGWEVCRQIKAAGDTPVIIMTGQVVTDIQISRLVPEADGYLLKPFDVRDVIGVLAAVLPAPSQTDQA